MTSAVNVRPGMPVVMVDDNETDIFIARRAYRKSRLDNPFYSVSGGRALLELLDKVEQGEMPMPGLVLLDINMPRMDGFQVLEAVREREGFKELPVVLMLTNSDNPRDREKAEQLGAQGFFTKPIDPQPFIDFFSSLHAGDGTP